MVYFEKSPRNRLVPIPRPQISTFPVGLDLDYDTESARMFDQLSPRQKEVVEGIFEGLTRDQIAMRMHMTRSTVLNAMRNPAVKAYFNQKRREIEEANMASIHEVICGFKDAIQDAKLAGDAGSQIAGWREIGKMLGYYAPEKRQVEVKNVDQLQNKLEQLSDDELLKLASPDAIEGEFTKVKDDSATAPRPRSPRARPPRVS